ncbi:hypothetical protein Tco_0429606 [Tanacetum coccineum]
MDRLSKRKFGIVCHEKVVRIPLEGDEILRVHGERTQGVVKTLMNTKFRIDLVHGATSVAKSPYRLAPLEMQELSEQLRELQDKGFIRPSHFPEELGSTYDTIRNMIILRIGSRRWNTEVSFEVSVGVTNGKENGVCKFSNVIQAEHLVCALVLALDRKENVGRLFYGQRLEREYLVVVRFGKKGKLAPKYVGPFEILERIDPIAYRLRLLEELSSVHDTFHVSNLKKCLADANLHVPLDEIKVDKTLRFFKEPVKIMDREIRKLKRRKIAPVKVRWNSKRGPEFTWEHEDQMRIKYP